MNYIHNLFDLSRWREQERRLSDSATNAQAASFPPNSPRLNNASDRRLDTINYEFIGFGMCVKQQQSTSGSFSVVAVDIDKVFYKVFSADECYWSVVHLGVGGFMWSLLESKCYPVFESVGSLGDGTVNKSIDIGSACYRIITPVCEEMWTVRNGFIAICEYWSMENQTCNSPCSTDEEYGCSEMYLEKDLWHWNFTYLLEDRNSGWSNIIPEEDHHLFRIYRDDSFEFTLALAETVEYCGDYEDSECAAKISDKTNLDKYLLRFEVTFGGTVEHQKWCHLVTKFEVWRDSKSAFYEEFESSYISTNHHAFWITHSNPLIDCWNSTGFFVSSCNQSLTFGIGDIFFSNTISTRSFSFSESINIKQHAVYANPGFNLSVCNEVLSESSAGVTLTTTSPTATPSVSPSSGGIGGANDWAYCREADEICSEGQGDCDSDSECAFGLTCGYDNCREFHPNAELHADCCYVPGSWYSCTNINKCPAGKGPCNDDVECAFGLTCVCTPDPQYLDEHIYTDSLCKCYDKPGIGASDDWAFCTNTNKCAIGQGDCDRDSDCDSGLTCGVDNCQSFSLNAAFTADCCYDKPGIGASDDWSYCTSTNKCATGEGDCDSDDDCNDGLACGVNNCLEFHENAEQFADCCTPL